MRDISIRSAIAVDPSRSGVKLHALPCRGHGTQVVEGSLMATVCGVIQRVNMLISVVPVKARSVEFFESAASLLLTYKLMQCAVCWSADTIQS